MTAGVGGCGGDNENFDHDSKEDSTKGAGWLGALLRFRHKFSTLSLASTLLRILFLLLLLLLLLLLPLIIF